MTLLVGRQEVHLACKKTEWWDAGTVMLVQELRAIYLLEMAKCLTGIFGKGLPWDIQNRTS